MPAQGTGGIGGFRRIKVAVFRCSLFYVYEQPERANRFIV